MNERTKVRFMRWPGGRGATTGRRRAASRTSPQQLLALQQNSSFPSLLIRRERGRDAIRALPPGSRIGCLARPSRRRRGRIARAITATHARDPGRRRCSEGSGASEGE
jgi:hypothetical protein